MTVTINQGTASTAQAYIDEQNLHKMLSAALNQLMSERAEKGITRLAEILQQSALAQDEEKRMHELFQMAAKGKGTIGMDELRTFCEIMGQPLDEVQLQVAFDEMNAQDRNGQISFAAFAAFSSVPNRAKSLQPPTEILVRFGPAGCIRPSLTVSAMAMSPAFWLATSVRLSMTPLSSLDSSEM